MAFEVEDAPKTALAIVAHPDDCEFGCGGTLTVLAQDGWEVHIAIVTDASGGGDDHAPDVSMTARKQISDRRKREQEAAAKVMGLTGVVFLDYPDGMVEPSIDLRRDLVRLMRRLQPTIVLCPSPDRIWEPVMSLGRFHPDHLAVGQATISAVYPATRNGWDFPELLAEGLMPHRVREVWIMSAPVLNHWVDITAAIDRKIEALRAHDSQLGAHFDELEPRMRSWMTESGEKYGVGAVEEFHRTTLG